MAEIELPELGEALVARSKGGGQGTTADSLYEVGQIPLADQNQFTAIIPVAVVEDKLLVCVPGGAWSKKVASRKLPPQALARPVACSVVWCDEDTRSPGDTESNMRVWVGMLQPTMEEFIRFDREDEPDITFGLVEGRGPAVPLAAALAEVCADRFTFMSADSGGGGRSQGQDRLDRLEASLAAIQESLAVLQGPKASTPAASAPAPTRPSALRPRPKPASVAPPPGLPGRVSFPGLDQGVVDSALTAGVSEKHLAEMSAMLSRHPQRMGDLPSRPRGAAAGGPLDESQDEEEEEAEGADDGALGVEDGTGPVEKAIVQLTKVCQALAVGKSKKNDPLEQLLDSTSLEKLGEGSGSASVRKNATALRALKRCLVERPDYIFRTVEAALASDFQSRPQRPGEPSGGGSVRGWLESRSRITNHQAHVRWSCSVAGIWDCLINGKTDEARARCALLISAADQTSIDGGSWLLSGVSLLEGPPPFQSFAMHQAPGPQELQHSALIDPRWVELYLSHVKDMDTYQETRKKLAKPAGVPRTEEPTPKPKPKAKVKMKGKGKGSDAEGEAPQS